MCSSSRPFAPSRQASNSQFPILNSSISSLSQPAIIVENLSKKFRIGTGGGPGYHRLSEAAAGIPRALYNSARNLFPDSSPRPETGRGAGGEEPVSTLNSSPDFWALKDVSFEVQPGEVVGIIGRNGAGKSTLLKVLSRITEPTSGRFGVRGRVASLLEVGTGFHPELTGRENIYVSGITLGMTRAEIKKRFDEIVDFSGVEKFLDTPVKHYSSGMQVRLGFAVAAHLESEILIVDEVLAVGDAEFQKKCVGKMSGIAGDGRTILFVSHNMQTVRSFCSTAVILNGGENENKCDASLAIQRYQQSREFCEWLTLRQTWNIETAPGNHRMRLVEFDIRPETGDVIEIRSGCRIKLVVACLEPIPFLDATVELRTLDGLIVLHDGFVFTAEDAESAAYQVLLSIPPWTLNAGTYSLSLIFGQYRSCLVWRQDDVVLLKVEHTYSAETPSPRPGVVRTRLKPTSEKRSLDSLPNKLSC